ncbi:MAG: ATPase domain-containing protein [Candidatus Bathyarchaeia archaeon]
MITARVRTGIVEFDKMLRGGFMERDAILVAGPPGTGKTTLGLEYLVNGASEFGENGVYVTFEQMPDQIYRDAATFGWDLRKLEREKKFKLVCTSPDLLVAGDGEHLLDEIIGQLKPRRIVIDSLSHLAMYIDEKNLRKETYRLLNYLKTKGLTSLSTWESSQIVGQDFTVTEIGVSFLVDCVVVLRLVEIESTMRKALVILKMRGSDHDRALREFHSTSHGIKLSKPFSGFQGVVTGIPRRNR